MTFRSAQADGLRRQAWPGRASSGASNRSWWAGFATGCSFPWEKPSIKDSGQRQQTLLSDRLNARIDSELREGEALVNQDELCAWSDDDDDERDA